MESFAAIQATLARVRQRLTRQSLIRSTMYALSACAAAGVAIPLIARVTPTYRAPYVAGAILGGAGVVLLVTVVVAALEIHRLRNLSRLARLVGQRAPAVSSDLLSAVELGGAAQTARFSPALIDALARSTANRLAEVDLAELAPPQRVRRAAWSFAAIAGAALCIAFAAPGALRKGWARAIRTDRDPLASARAATAPIVGDIEIALTFPAYTGRPPVTLPASSGDFRAMPGTAVRISTIALLHSESAELILSPESGPAEPASPPAPSAASTAPDSGAPAADSAPENPTPDTQRRREVLRAAQRAADQTLPMEVDGNQLRVAFTVQSPAQYRFLLRAPTRAPAVEATPHTIEIERDAAPVVELYAPADELDVEKRRRIELAYTTEDDYGIGAIALVWAAEGGESGRVALPAPAPGSRSAQAKFLWDLGEVPLPPGARISYHLEVADNDTVSGPNIGRSKSYALRVFSPRERHEELLARQKALFEAMARLLGDRLTAPAEDLALHRELAKLANRVVVELGGILSDLTEDQFAPKDLAPALQAMHDRLEKLGAAETALLSSLGETGNRRTTARLAASDEKNVVELEADVLELADWLDRLELQTMLSLADEIAERRKHIQELLEEFARTGDPKLMAEIQREMRALEQAMAELAQKQGRLDADVLDRFVNQDAMDKQKSEDCLAKVRALIASGDAAAAAKQMQLCNEEFDSAAQQLANSLDELMRDRFADQQRKMDELEGKLRDLASDQQAIARDADELMESYSRRASELLSDKAKDARSAARKLIKQLRKELRDVPKAGLTPFSQDELPVVSERLDDVEAMLDDGDLPEALAMAEQAELTLETVEAELGANLDGGEPWSSSTPDSYNEVAEALPLARELVEALRRTTPKASDAMSAEDQARMRELGKRQRAVRKRADQLADSARKQSEGLPNHAGDGMADSVEQAMKYMEDAEQRMNRSDPSGSRQSARDAADALQQGAEKLRRERMARGQHGLSEEPVRIPGADEYSTPAEFREEILEAMKKEAPGEFVEQVKRYYEELIRW